MIFYGWGKDLKQIAYAGVEKCPNCKNFGHFSLCENSSYASLYFVTVAKWNKKYFLMCELCQKGCEIDAAGKDELLRMTIAIPPKEHVAEIWNRLEIAYTDAEAMPGDHTKAFAYTLNAALMQLKSAYSENHVAYVANRYAQWLKDDDGPQ